MKLKNFITIDNTTRLSVGIRQSTDKALEAYIAYFKKAHNLPAEFDVSKSEFIERVLRQFMAEDKDFAAIYADAKKLAE